MALVLPPLPKLLDVAGVKDLQDLAKRTGEWGRAAQDLLRGLRQQSLEQNRALSSVSSDLASHSSTHLPSGSDPLTTAAAGIIQPDDSAAEGTAESFARSDHKHAIVAAAAGAATPGDAAAEGTATSFARSDHKHSLPAFGTSAGTFCQGNDSRLSDARTPTSHHTSHESGGSDEIKLDDLKAPDDNTDLNTSTTKHGLMKKLSGNANEVFTGDGNWTAFGETGGASVLKQYLADIAPSSPHTQDDEFDDNSISGNWTTWDLGSVNPTFTEDTNGLSMTYTGNGAHRWVGKYKATPNSECAVIVKMACGGVFDGTGGGQAAIALFQDPTSTTADIRMAEISQAQTANSSAFATRTWAAYNTSAGLTQSTVTVTAMTWIYVRVRLNGTSCSTDFSTDGRVWKQHAAVTLTFTPSHWGLAFDQFGSGLDATGWFRYWRVWSGAGSSGFNASSIGSWKNILYQ